MKLFDVSRQTLTHGEVLEVVAPTAERALEMMQLDPRSHVARDLGPANPRMFDGGVHVFELKLKPN